jgi:hypothetical protein
MQSDVFLLKLSSLKRSISQGMGGLASRAVRSGILLDSVAPTRVLGSVPHRITGVSLLDKAERKHLAFCNLLREDPIRKISASGAGVLISRDDLAWLEKRR